jgi:hypothetical protein
MSNDKLLDAPMGVCETCGAENMVGVFREYQKRECFSCLMKYSWFIELATECFRAGKAIFISPSTIYYDPER